MEKMKKVGLKWLWYSLKINWLKFDRSKPLQGELHVVRKVTCIGTGQYKMITSY